MGNIKCTVVQQEKLFTTINTQIKNYIKAVWPCAKSVSCQIPPRI